VQFAFDDEQLLLRDSVRALCADRFDLDAIASREGQPADASTWAALAGIGVLGMLGAAPDEGIGIVEAAIVFEQLGAHLASGPVLWSALGAPFVAGVVDGSVRVAGVDVGDGTSNRPVVVEHARESDVVLVVRDDSVVRCERASLVDLVDGSPLDPTTPTGVLARVPTGDVVGDEADVAALRLGGQVLAAAMLVGVAQGALDVARDYALDRRQFGAPIGSFQAVKHLLADMYVRVELARAATYAAAATVADPRAGDPSRAAASAKLLAGDAGVVNGRTAVQVLGGMGFTWDMLPHRFLKRAWVLEHQFGTSSTHATALGAAVGADATSAPSSQRKV
jgi:alkylation response protein AidB-like acyl-CoA dehydrogenase